MLWKISSRCDRIPNSYNQYQAIRQDALLIKADSRAQENGTWAFNKWATQEKLAVRRHTYRLSWDNSCDQQINELYRHLKQNKSCNHRMSASASNDASRQAEEAFAWKLRLRPCVTASSWNCFSFAVFVINSLATPHRQAKLKNSISRRGLKIVF